MVSKLIYGTLTLGPLQRNMDVALGAKCLCYAYDKGITTFDTAQYYKTYPYLKELLKYKKDAKIITKSYAYDENTARIAVEEAFRELGRDYIDVFLLHEQESEHTIRGHYEALSFYLKMKEKGYIGALGLSTHHVKGVLGAIFYDELSIIHPMINYKGLGIVDGDRKDMEEALVQAKAKGKGIFAMKVLGGGNLINDCNTALDYALSLPSIDAIALGMCSENEIDYNVAYFNGDKAALKKVPPIKKDKFLHIEDYCTCCGNCVKACPQDALSINEGKATVNKDLCVLCGYCSPVCDEFAIKVI